jgi:hypothetical protein
MMGNILDELKFFFYGKKMAEKKLALPLLLFLLCPLLLFSEADPSQFNVNGVFSFRQELERFPDRSEGSNGETNAFFIITETLKREKIPYTLIPFEDLDTTSSRSLILETVIKGLNNTELVLVVPVNNGETGLSGGGINIALALETICLLHESPGQMTLRVLFMGSEKRGDPGQGPLGSTHYVEDIREENPALVIYLDMERPTRRLLLDTGSKTPVTPLWLIRDINRVLQTAGLESGFSEAATHMARTGLAAMTSPLTPWLEDEIPAIRITGGANDPLLTEWEQKIWVSRMGRFLAGMANLYNETIPDEWDSNYAAFNFPWGGQLLIPEQSLVLAYYLILAFLILLTVLQERKLRFNIRKEFHHIWTIPLFLFLAFLFLFISTLILELTCAIRDFPALWMEAPRIFFIFKITLTYLLTLVFLHLVGGLPISRSPHFYSYAATVSTLLNLLILSLIHVSLSLYFLWTMLLLILFQLVRPILLKTLLAALMPVLTILALYQILSTEHLEFVRLVLLSRKAGNFLIAMGVLPFLFVISSLNNHSFYYTGSRRKTGVFLSTLTSGLTAGLLLFYILFLINPWKHREQPLEILRNIDLSEMIQTITLTSPAPLPDLKMTIPDQETLHLFKPGRSKTVTEPYTGPELIIRKEKEKFLNREKYTFRMEAPGRIRQIGLTLTSVDTLSIYNCNYPFGMSPDGKTAIIHTGINPPQPFVFELTLLTGNSGVLETVITLSDFESPLAVSGSNLTTKQSTVFRTLIPLGLEKPSP